MLAAVAAYLISSQLLLLAFWLCTSEYIVIRDVCYYYWSKQSPINMITLQD